MGSLLQVFFLRSGHETVDEISDMRMLGACVDAGYFSRFAHAMFDRGVYLSPSPSLNWTLSTVHTDEDVDRIITAAGDVLASLPVKST